MGEGANPMNRDEPRGDSFTDNDAVVIRETTIARVPDTGDETEEIRANIEQTRAEMSETIDALQDRLSPTALKEQAQDQFDDIKEHVKEQVREQFQEAKTMVREATIGRVENMVQNASDTVNDARYTMMDTIRENPIPAALVGIGLGWLFMNRSSRTPTRYSGRGGVRGSQPDYERSRYYDDRRGYYDAPRYYDNQRGYETGTVSQVRQGASNVIDRAQDTASNVAGRVQDTASNVASNVSETASNIADRAQETASNLADQAQYQAQRVEDRFQESLRTNPLAVGAIALALGTAVGLALPETEKENQLMGEARDNLFDKAQEVASDTMDKVQRVASEVTSEAKQTVKEQAREQGLTS